MEIIYFLVPIALLLAATFLVAFIYSNKSGQFDDLDSPSVKIF